VKARCEIDLKIGAVFTRFQTLHIRGKYGKFSNEVISYGPCQFPTLGFVVEQHNKIHAFVPEAFWSLSLELESPDSDDPSKKIATSFSWDRYDVFNLRIFVPFN
jgi:DNA topoisomerase-3